MVNQKIVRVLLVRLEEEHEHYYEGSLIESPGPMALVTELACGHRLIGALVLPQIVALPCLECGGEQEAEILRAQSVDTQNLLGGQIILPKEFGRG